MEIESTQKCLLFRSYFYIIRYGGFCISNYSMVVIVYICIFRSTPLLTGTHAVFLALGTQTVGNASRIVKEALALPATHHPRFLSLTACTSEQIH